MSRISFAGNPSVGCALLFFLISVFGSADTVQDFDKGNQICSKGTACAAVANASDPPPTLLNGGPGGVGRFLRLGFGEIEDVPNFNTIAFEQTDAIADLVVIDFDFRITPGEGRADGFGFSFLDVEEYGISGELGGTGEEPNFVNSVGVGFDIYQNEDLNDIGNDAVRENFSNSVSLHFNGVITQVDATPIVDLGAGLWIHARIIVRMGGGFGDVTVLFAPPDCPLTPVIEQFHIDGLAPYAGRAHFGARSGGQTADVDLDNIRLVSGELDATLYALSTTRYLAQERDGVANVEVTRFGNADVPAKVTLDAKATGTAGDTTDFTPISVPIDFGIGEISKVVPISLTTDSEKESDEQFALSLRKPKLGGKLAGPASAQVVIVDDETAKSKGAWDRLHPWPIVAVHMHVLPTGKVAIWDRLGAAAIWDPETGVAELSSTPGYNLFCSGHAFLGDGSLLVTGGHADLGGHPIADGVGEEEATLYIAETDSWLALPNMNARRWYPTNLVLPNGDMLVLSGTINGFATKNNLPQVWQVTQSSWRNLTSAEEGFPLGVDLYPRMFVVSENVVFKAGMDALCFFLDTSGTGEWTVGPTTKTGYHLYGIASQYAPGKILTAGGSDFNNSGEESILPHKQAEVIDLTVNNPKWRKVNPMKFARRHHNATVLPDGTVLVTGGTSGNGFSNPKTPVLAAELWDPETEKWRQMASMRVPRLYHSSAFLLPDGRVLSAGGGQGAVIETFHNLAEVYYPPYFFKGARPVINDVPQALVYGETFTIDCTQRSKIEKVALIRLPSVTHAFDMNQNYVPLSFNDNGSVLVATAPANGVEAQPGHYMLFVLNQKGVPSVARIVQLTQ